MTEKKRRARSGVVARTVLFAATLAVGIGLASFPVSTWLEQRSELRDARAQRSELIEQIDGINIEIAQRIGPDGVAKAAKCFGPYVEPGSEVYSVPGVEGCVSLP